MISALVSFVVRVLLMIATAVLVLGLLAIALITVLGLIVWSLIRGRKPRVDMGRFARARQPFGPRATAQRADPRDIVDVEAREVHAAPPAAPRLEQR